MKLNLDAIFSFPVKVILGKKRRHINDGLYKRLRFNCFGFLLGILYCGGLFFNDITRNSLLAIGLDLFIIFSCLTLAIVVRWSSAYRFVFHATVLIVAIVLPIGYFAPTGNRTVFLTPLILILAYFLHGRASGLFYTFLILGANLIAYEISRHNLAELPVSAQSLGYSSLALGMISALLFIYEGVNVANERRIAQRDKRLRVVNNKLNEELAKRYELTLQLTENLHQTKKSNEILEQTKHTLTAALDNTNRLKEQLALEKKSVEHQVELRTHQLHEEQARLQASIATLELGFLMVFPGGEVVMHNPALLKICDLKGGSSEDSLLSQLERKVSPSYDLKAAIDKCLAGGKRFDAADIELDDKFIRILGSAIRLRGQESPLGVVILVEDMTASKLLERREDEFVAIASHELRTPLTIIQGNLSMIDEIYAHKLDDPQMKRMMDNVQDSSARMIMIVNQFLKMTRLEQKTAKFKVEEIDVRQIISTTILELQPLVDEKNLQVVIEVPPRLPKVKADSSRLQEILTNLIGNAIKYTDKGHITVSAVHADKKVTILVADTGRGIAVANHKLLFHKFQQATDNIYTRDDSRSTGLGLYISKLLAEQMGGLIKLDSSVPAKGSTFSLTLPEA